MFWVALSTIIPILIAVSWRLNIFPWFCSFCSNQCKEYRRRQYPNRIIFVRHGESEANVKPSLYATVPDNEIRLTDVGREQARLCGEKLSKIIGEDETVMFYFSPFRRTSETCEYISKSFPSNRIYKFREDPRIREQEWGNFQYPEMEEQIRQQRKTVGRFFYRFPSGESGADVYDRVSSFIESLYREMDSLQNPNLNMVIVTHGLFIRLFLMRFYRWPVKKFESMPNFANCEFIVLERTHHKDKYIFEPTTNIKFNESRNE